MRPAPEEPGQSPESSRSCQQKQEGERPSRKQLQWTRRGQARGRGEMRGRSWTVRAQAWERRVCHRECQKRDCGEERKPRPRRKLPAPPPTPSADAGRDQVLFLASRSSEHLVRCLETGRLGQKGSLSS